MVTLRTSLCARDAKEKFAAALKSAGKTFTYITYPNEGHGSWNAITAVMPTSVSLHSLTSTSKLMRHLSFPITRRSGRRNEDARDPGKYPLLVATGFHA